jgi:hypothetical protein
MVFKARPMPVVDRVFTPKHSDKAPTTPSPFKLATEDRGKKHRDDFEAQLSGIIASEKSAHEFHAQPILVGAPLVLCQPF